MQFARIAYCMTDLLSKMTMTDPRPRQEMEFELVVG